MKITVNCNTSITSSTHKDRVELEEEWDNCQEAIGRVEMLDAIFKYLSTDTIEEMLEDFRRYYDM